MALNDAENMLSALQNANSILLCTHASPDGDAIGSLIAMGLALEGLGKRVVMACADPVPHMFRFLPGADRVVNAEALTDQRFDMGMALDAASLERLGKCEEAFLRCPVTAQLDHHGDNPGYARMNWVDGEASAAGCLVHRMMKKMGLPVTREIAMNLYCAISTDTGNFRFLNTTAEAFAIMAELMEAGLDLPAVARPVHQVREIPAARLLGKALDSLRLIAGGKCACMRLTRDDYRAAGALPEHNTGIVNYALDLPGVEMAYLAEERPGECKASLRAIAPWNVQKIASRFGGGGHVQASGLTYKGSLRELEEKLDAAMTAALSKDI